MYYTPINKQGYSFEVLFLQHKIILTYRSYNKKAGSNRFTKCTSTNQRLWISSLGQIPKPPLQNSVLKTSAPQHQDLEFNLHFRLSSVWSMHVFPVSVQILSGYCIYSPCQIHASGFATLNHPYMLHVQFLWVLWFILIAKYMLVNWTH